MTAYTLFPGSAGSYGRHSYPIRRTGSTKLNGDRAPEDSMAEEMTGRAEKVPAVGPLYRKSSCTGDMGFGACKLTTWKYGPHRTPTASLPAPTFGIAHVGRGTLPVKSDKKPVWFIPLNGHLMLECIVGCRMKLSVLMSYRVIEVLRPHMND